MPNMKMERSWLKLTFKGQIGKIREKKKEREMRRLSFLNSEAKKAKEIDQRIKTPLKETKGK